MQRIVAGLVLAGLAAGLCSCARIGRLVEGKQAPTGIPEVPPQFRGAGGGPSDSVARVTLEDAQDVTPENIERVRDREKDLMWTDFDNPEESLQELTKIVKPQATRGPWMVSFQEAQKVAMREGKPLLLWFTDTQRSPLCKSLSAEVFSKKEFGSWAEEEVVRVRLDFNVKGESRGPGHSAMDDRVRKLNYLESLKKRYKVLGLPMVLLVAPDGTVTGRYRGYQRTYGDFYLKRLQYDTESARKHHEDWKEKMSRRGYREWNDSTGRRVFAKLLRYDQGELILVEPDGQRLRTQEEKLSGEDRDWIRREKEKRGE